MQTSSASATGVSPWVSTRLPIVALWTAGMVVGLSALATADMYYYRDRNGQLHLTNVLSSIPPTYRSSVVKAATPQGRSIVSTPERKDSESRAQALQPRPTAAPAAGSQAMSVNTRQFGLLQLRMTDFEVLQRLGQPAAITEVGRPASGALESGRTIRVVRGETWYYPGNGAVPPTRLEFSNGLLVYKQRLQR
jgi:hypothetical protein